MKKLLLSLLAGALALASPAQTPINVTKTSGTNVINNGPIVVGSGNSITIAAGGTLTLANGATLGLGSALPWSVLTAIPSPAAAATGDATGNLTLLSSGSGSLVLTLAASGASAGTYGDSTHVGAVTVDAKGRVTSASQVSISASSLGALLAANNLSELANKATSRTNLGVEIGTNVEAWSATLDSFATAGNAPSYYLTATNLSAGTLPAARLPAFSGDATSSSGSSALTLAASGVSAGSYGDATHVAAVTVDAKGRVTAASQVSIAIPLAWGAITGIPNSVFSLTGDGTASISTTALGTASGALTLANSGVTAGTYGSASQSLTATVDAKGRLTGLSANSVTPAWANVSGNPFTVSAGKSVTFSNTLTFTGTDGSSLNVGTGGTLGTAAFTAATAYAPATSGAAILYGNGSGGFSSVVIGANLTFSGGTLSASGAGTVSNVATGTGLSGGPITTTGTISLAAGYAGNGIGTVNGVAYGNGSGTIAAVTIGTGLNFSTGTLSFTGLTGFTSGNLSPLFTTALGGSPTLSPALTFALSNAAANTVFGNATGSSAAPSYNPLGTSLAYSAGSLNTIQGIRTTDSPTFAGLTTSGNAGIAAAISSSSALVVAASTTGVSSLRILHGAAPTAPVDGDVWTTTAGLYARINGATVGPLLGVAVTSLAGTSNEIAVNVSTGAVTASLPSTLTFTGKTITGGTFNSGVFNGSVGASTPAAGSFTTVTASGQIVSTVSTGTSPLVVASQSLVTNLNASLLLGSTWAIPAAIGSTTPAAGSFTTLGATGLATFAAGTVGGPEIHFGADTTSGFYRIGANNIGLAISASKVLDVSSTGLGVTGSVTANIGGAGTALDVTDSVNHLAVAFAAGQAARIFNSNGTGISIRNAVNSTDVGVFSNTGLAVTGELSGGVTATGGSTQRTLAARFGQVVNIRDYGAAPGNSDSANTTAINAAIAALSNYSTLYIPAGKYGINGGLTALSSLNHVTIAGDGWSSEIHSSVTGAAGNTFVVNTTCSNITIRNLAITGSATVRGSGIHIRLYASDSTVTGCYLSGCSDFAIHVGNDSGTGWSTRFIVSNNTIYAPLGDGIHVGAATNVLIEHNMIESTGDDAIGVVADDVAHVPNRVLVQNNNIYNAGGLGTSVSGCGIRIAEANDVSVQNNSVFTTYESGIRITRYTSITAYNNRVAVEHNQLSNCGGHSGSNTMDVSFAYLAKIDGNALNDGVFGVGIMLLDLIDSTIQNNVFRNMPTGGIRTDSTTTHVATTWGVLTVKNNTFVYILANEAIYLIPGSGITLQDMFVDGNIGITINSGAFINYNRVTGGAVVNNTRLAAATITAGGTVSGVATANNN